MTNKALAAVTAVALLAACSTKPVERAVKDGEWGCLGGTAAGAVAGALVGGVLMKGLGGNHTLRTVGGVGGGLGGAALGEHLACK